MDKCTHEMRAKYWADIISQCQARPEGLTAKQWLKNNGICEQSYYVWLRKLRQQAYKQLTVPNQPLPVSVAKEEVSFVEIPITGSISKDPVIEMSVTPVAVIKKDGLSIAISSDISEALLSKIIQEVVSHA